MGVTPSQPSGSRLLRAFLRGHRLVCLDTSVFIYHLEADPQYVELTNCIFLWLEGPEARAITSTIAMTELLVQPYAKREEELVDRFYAELVIYPNLDWIAPTLQIADTAARFRAAHGLRTPDALLAATAVHSGATGLITNDAVFQRVPGFETAVLDRFL